MMELPLVHAHFVVFYCGLIQVMFNHIFQVHFAITGQLCDIWLPWYQGSKLVKYGWINNINTLRPRRNEQHFTDVIFKCIFFSENVWISIKIALKFVPKGPINNIPAMVQIMAWRRSGDKPLSEPMMVSLPTYICITRPQWVNLLRMKRKHHYRIWPKTCAYFMWNLCKI